MARLHTVGHSDRSAGAFLEILRAHDVELLVDVRRHPGSGRHPHFNRDQLRGMAEVREDHRVVYPPGDGGQTELFDDDPAAGEAGP